MFFFLAYFTLYNRLQFHPSHQNWFQCILFNGWVILHCVYVPQLSYPFICWWTSRLFPCPGCYKQCCNELLEENIGKTLSDINHSRILYDPPPRILEIKAKTNKWNLIKIKSFCTTKETISKVKRQPSEWEKIIANEATDKQLSFCFLTHQSVVLIYSIRGTNTPYQYTLYVYCVHFCMMTLAIIVGIYTVTKMRDSSRKFSSKNNGDSNSITFTKPRRKENSKSNKNIEKECNQKRHAAAAAKLLQSCPE